MQLRSFVALALAGLCAFASSAEARCAAVSLPAEVRQAPFVVEAVLERAGDPAHFRTVTVWKGGDQAPARFTLGARQGRGYWPWREASNVGHRYLLFLREIGNGFVVRRCGVSGDATDARRRQLRAQGLRAQDQRDGSGPRLDQSEPVRVVEALFAAARSGRYGPLAGLCDPSGENDGDTRGICALGRDPSGAAPFVAAFENGRVADSARTRGDRASVPFLFGPDGDRRETMELIRRDGRWYLSSF